MKFDNKKNDKKKVNVKVVATGFVAITLLGIAGISIGRFSSQKPLNMSFVMDSVNAVGANLNQGFTFLKDNMEDIFNYKENVNKVKNLEEENQELEKYVIELKEELEAASGLEELKESLNFIDEAYQANKVSSKVVSKNDGNWYTTLTIGVGSKSGVKKDSIVVNGDGLVGMVYEVSENYCKAISLLDTKSSVSFKLMKDSEFTGIIDYSSKIDDSDDYKEKGYLKGYMMDTEYDVLQGDVIVTSGLGIYPEGIPIGEVEKVIDDKNTSRKYVSVKPYVDFKHVDEVTIIEPRNVK